MAYNALNNLIDAYIYANGVQAITGQILNGVLKQMVSQLGSGYHLMGVAGPETVPASNDYAMAYFAATAGEYTDFGGITLAAGEVAVLLTSGNGSWSKQTVYNVPTGTADLENTANFITNAVTDLVNYYTKTEVDDTLANYPTLEALATVLADYYTKTEIDTILADYTTNTALASALADYYNKNDIDGLLSVVNAALADRYTKSETDTKLGDYYKKTETYDKDEVDSIVAALSRQEYIVAWDGLAAPDVSSIPAGVTVTYSGTPYTGTLAASASTVNKIYMVWNGTAYDMYSTSQDGGYSWVPMGTTTVDLSQYATKAELSQLEDALSNFEHWVTGEDYDFSASASRKFYGTDGTVYQNGNRKKTIPIPVKKGDKIAYKCENSLNIFMIAALDSSQNLVSAASVAGTGSASEGVYVVPDGVSFVTASCNLSFSSPYCYIKDSILERVGFLEKDTKGIVINSFATNEIESGKYINGSGVILTAASGYRIVKLYLKAGNYYLHIPESSQSTRVLYKYSDDTYSSGATQIVGVVTSEYTDVKSLQEGYYCLSWFSSNATINDRESLLVAIDNLRLILSEIERPVEDVISEIGKTLYTPFSVEFINGKYIAFNNGNEYSNADYAYTDFVPVLPYMQLLLNGFSGSNSVASVACYDINKQYIPDKSTKQKDIFLFVVPEGVSYIRFSYQLSTGDAKVSFNDDLTKKLDRKIGKNLLSGVGLDNSYLYSNGGVYSNPDYYISEYIPILGGKNYHISQDGDSAISSAGAYFVFYDENLGMLSAISGNNLTVTAPDDAKYLRASILKSAVKVQIEQGEGRTQYEPYSELGGYTLNVSINDLDQQYNQSTRAAISMVGSNAEIVTADTLSENEVLSASSFPKSLKKGHVFSFYADITNFGDGVYLGFGYQSLYACGIKITDTNVIVLKQENEQGQPIPHGLTFASFIKVSASSHNGKLLLVITTLNGYFKTVIDTWGWGVNGTPQARAFASVSFTNARFTVGNADLKKPIWSFGDSYFHFDTSNRVMYWLKEWGYVNMLVDGFGGASAADAYADLQRALNYNCPKYIVWALGMNGNYDTWNTYYQSLKAVCQERNITLILCTIPVVHDVSYTGKQDITDAVRNSGYRYIDTYKAVGANSSGDWYNNGLTNDYQSGDGIHPSTFGARAIASQWLIDFPELMQYGVVNEESYL